MDPIPLYEIVAVVISTGVLAGLALWGLWAVRGLSRLDQPEPRPNRKLTHTERLVRTGSVKRVL